MIFVIGDIHGMYDPLKVAVDYIYQVATKSDKVNQVIFLGDYIDCGPSSKQVIDLILQVRQDFPTVTLLGNHEEMLLSYYHKVFEFTKIGNLWLNFNGGVQTILSFYPQSVLFKAQEFPNEKAVSELLHLDNVLKLDEIYLKFFENLSVSHIEKLQSPNGEIELLFSHSAFSNRYSLEKQLAVSNWKDLPHFLTEINMDIEESNIWNRQLLNEPLRDNMILIHGHTPTRFYKQITKLLRFWEDEENAPFVARDRKTKQVMQIDIDTGLVYGGSLTMLAIDDSPDAVNLFPYYISIEPKKGFRSKLYHKKMLDLS